MKGIIFRTFLDLIEEKFSLSIVDQLLESTKDQLPSQGVYTTVGIYSHEEIVTLVVQLSRITGIEIPVLIRTFGEYLFHVLYRKYAHLFRDIHHAFQFLESLEGFIHVEVKKLYPEAEIPRFATKRIDEKTLSVLYISQRHFDDLAEGMILSCIQHYGNSITLINKQKHDADSCEFILREE